MRQLSALLTSGFSGNEGETEQNTQSIMLTRFENDKASPTAQNMIYTVNLFAMMMPIFAATFFYLLLTVQTKFALFFIALIAEQGCFGATRLAHALQWAEQRVGHEAAAEGPCHVVLERRLYHVAAHSCARRRPAGAWFCTVAAQGHRPLHQRRLVGELRRTAPQVLLHLSTARRYWDRDAHAAAPMAFAIFTQS